MKAIFAREKKKRNKRFQKEEKLLVLKCLNQNFKLDLNWWSKYKINTCATNHAFSRCIITNRAKATNKTFKLSRHEFKRWNRMSVLPGVEKSSW